VIWPYYLGLASLIAVSLVSVLQARELKLGEFRFVGLWSLIMQKNAALSMIQPGDCFIRSVEQLR
jgi:hypothetical protein